MTKLVTLKFNESFSSNHVTIASGPSATPISGATIIRLDDVVEVRLFNLLKYTHLHGCEEIQNIDQIFDNFSSCAFENVLVNQIYQFGFIKLLQEDNFDVLMDRLGKDIEANPNTEYAQRLTRARLFLLRAIKELVDKNKLPDENQARKFYEKEKPNLVSLNQPALLDGQALKWFNEYQTAFNAFNNALTLENITEFNAVEKAQLILKQVVVYRKKCDALLKALSDEQPSSWFAWSQYAQDKRKAYIQFEENVNAQKAEVDHVATTVIQSLLAQYPRAYWTNEFNPFVQADKVFGQEINTVNTFFKAVLNGENPAMPAGEELVDIYKQILSFIMREDVSQDQKINAFRFCLFLAPVDVEHMNLNDAFKLVQFLKLMQVSVEQYVNNAKGEGDFKQILKNFSAVQKVNAYLTELNSNQTANTTSIQATKEIIKRQIEVFSARYTAYLAQQEKSDELLEKDKPNNSNSAMPASSSFIYAAHGFFYEKNLANQTLDTSQTALFQIVTFTHDTADSGVYQYQDWANAVKTYYEEIKLLFNPVQDYKDKAENFVKNLLKGKDLVNLSEIMEFFKFYGARINPAAADAVIAVLHHYVTTGEVAHPDLAEARIKEKANAWWTAWWWPWNWFKSNIVTPVPDTTSVDYKALSFDELLSKLESVNTKLERKLLALEIVQRLSVLTIEQANFAPTTQHKEILNRAAVSSNPRHKTYQRILCESYLREINYCFDQGLALEPALFDQQLISIRLKLEYLRDKDQERYQLAKQKLHAYSANDSEEFNKLKAQHRVEPASPSKAPGAIGSATVALTRKFIEPTDAGMREAHAKELSKLHEGKRKPLKSVIIKRINALIAAAPTQKPVAYLNQRFADFQIYLLGEMSKLKPTRENDSDQVLQQAALQAIHADSEHAATVLIMEELGDDTQKAVVGGNQLVALDPKPVLLKLLDEMLDAVKMCVGDQGTSVIKLVTTFPTFVNLITQLASQDVDLLTGGIEAVKLKIKQNYSGNLEEVDALFSTSFFGRNDNNIHEVRCALHLAVAIQKAINSLKGNVDISTVLRTYQSAVTLLSTHLESDDAKRILTDNGGNHSDLKKLFMINHCFASYKPAAPGMQHSGTALETLFTSTNQLVPLYGISTAQQTEQYRNRNRGIFNS